MAGCKRCKIHADTSVEPGGMPGKIDIAGKIGQLIKAIYGGNTEAMSAVAHGLYRISFLSPSTVTLRLRREEGEFDAVVPGADSDGLKQSSDGLMERIKRQLSMKKIGVWLDEQGGGNTALFPEKLITDKDSYIRFVHALLYGDSRTDFRYAIEEASEENDKTVTTAGYVVPAVRLCRKTAAGAEA